MAARQVLSIGQCGFDSASLERLFADEFSATVLSVDSAREAAEALEESRFDLILVNRRLDADGASGVALIETLQAQAAGTPIMLVSDRPDAQAAAAAAGAAPGFGKSALHSPDTRARIQAVLDAAS